MTQRRIPWLCSLKYCLWKLRYPNGTQTLLRYASLLCFNELMQFPISIFDSMYVRMFVDFVSVCDQIRSINEVRNMFEKHKIYTDINA